MASPLDYSFDLVKSRWPFRFAIAGAVVVAIIVYTSCRGDIRTSADINLSTGDIRYRYFGIPLEYNRMPEPQRSQLQALAAKSSVLKDGWHFCGSFPLKSSCDEALLWRSQWFYAAAWASADPAVAQLMLEDAAKSLITGGPSAGANSMLSQVYVRRNASGKYVVEGGWHDDAEVRIYMASKGYSPPPPPTTLPATPR